MGANLLPLQAYTKCWPMWVQRFCLHGHKTIASGHTQKVCHCRRTQNVSICGRKNFASMGATLLPLWAHTKIGAIILPLGTTSAGTHKMLAYVGTKLLPLWVHTKLGWAQKFCLCRRRQNVGPCGWKHLASMGATLLPPWAEKLCLCRLKYFASVGANILAM